MMGTVAMKTFSWATTAIMPVMVAQACRQAGRFMQPPGDTFIE